MTWKLYGCRLCGRVSEHRRGFLAAGGDNDTWECANDRACKRRRVRRDTGQNPSREAMSDRLRPGLG